MIKLAATVGTPAKGGVPAFPGDNSRPGAPTTDETLPVVTQVPSTDPAIVAAKIGAGVVNVLLYIAGALAVIYMIYNGMQLILSGGDESKLATAKKNFINGLIGVAVITLTFFLAYLIRNSIVTTNPAATSSTTPTTVLPAPPAGHQAGPPQ